MKAHRIAQHILMGMMGLLAIACSKRETPLEQYIEQTNAQCPMPLSAHSDSEFRGIELKDSMLKFSYVIAENEVDWNDARRTLRKQVVNTLTSTLPEMQQLVKLMLDAKVGAHFHYQSRTEATKEIIITFTPTEIVNMMRPHAPKPQPQEDDCLKHMVDSFAKHTPMELNEGCVLTDIAINADTLLLSITLPEEVFMALNTQSTDDTPLAIAEMREALGKTAINELLTTDAHLSTIRVTYVGITSQEQVHLNLPGK
ncbi:MAG: hypothetical protein J6R91_01920 [Bacteroidaceae bacterium]|nr:hypothetical protein [Bacteroidaceae bacterium]